MLNTNPDVVLVFHHCLEKSKGTKQCANEAKKRGKTIFEISPNSRASIDFKNLHTEILKKIS